MSTVALAIVGYMPGLSEKVFTPTTSECIGCIAKLAWRYGDVVAGWRHGGTRTTGFA
jgi:hypothetical protein